MGAGWECCDSAGWDCSRKVSCNLQNCECSQQNKSGEQLELWLWGLSGHCDTWSFWRLNNSWERKVARTANNCGGQKKSCTHRIRQNWSQWGYSVWKLDTPLSAKCLCIHWDSFIVNDLLISELCDFCSHGKMADLWQKRDGDCVRFWISSSGGEGYSALHNWNWQPISEKWIDAKLKDSTWK